MKFLFLLFFITISVLNVNAYIEMVVPDYKYALDLELYESVLNPELCAEQMAYILSSNDTELTFTFVDSNGRTPRGVLRGNTIDLGNYHQCLGINQEIPGSEVQGKYCLIELPFEQEINWPTLPDLPDLPDLPWPEFPWPDLDPRTRRWSDKTLGSLKEYNIRREGLDRLFGGNVDTKLGRYDNSLIGGLSFKLAFCIPKTCSTQNALGAVTNLTELNLVYDDLFCRLPNDKPWRAGDIVAISIFSFFGFLALLSTIYDLHYNVLKQKDPKKVNKILLSFSVFTNTRRLVTYNPVPGAIECLDGIRAIAMMWVIIGHTYVTQITSGIQYNPLDLLEYIMSVRNIWVTSGPITVDTFFMLSGLLLVYTTNGKMKPMRLLKNLHLFYLNRILRILPVLCATILIQISFVNWFVDGPYWRATMQHIHQCRVNWWSTILHVQNFVNPSAMCLSHSWYLAIDMQMYIISPIILLWVLTGNKRIAWTALITGLVAVLIGSGVYNFIFAFPSGPIIPSRLDEQERYVYYYYVNTLCRASPFFVGLIYGYVLSNHRGQTMNLNKIFVAIGHVCAIVISALIMYSSYPIMQYDWDNQFADDMINTFMRPAWALSVGWMVLCCVHGYAGPINWILSLRAWKVLSRISYAMYLTHYPMIFAVNAIPIAPVYFSGPSSVFKFFSDFLLAVMVSFFVTVLIDSPCSTLIKHFLGGGGKRPPPAKTEPEVQDKKADDNLLADKTQIDNNIVQGMSSTEHLVSEKVPLEDGVQVSRF